MPFKKALLSTSSLVLAASLALHSGAALAQSKIGVTAVAKNQVEGILSGKTRSLNTGTDIFAREVVRTGDASTAQLLFLDETTLVVGPQSEVTLDRFVFNPNRQAGSVVLNTTRGAFRFVSGSQQPSSYQIKTPVATIGVRGTIVEWFVFLTRSIFVLVSGAADFKLANGQVVHLTIPGTALVVTATGYEVVKWDGSNLNVAGGVPLFGYPFGAPTAQIESPDGSINLIDQLSGLYPYQPYPPPPDGVGYMRVR